MRLLAIRLGTLLIPAVAASASGLQTSAPAQGLPSAPGVTRTVQALRDASLLKTPEPAPSDTGPPNSLQPGSQILSDTQGVDFAPYMRRLHNDIQRNWDPLIPKKVEPPGEKKGVVGIRFTILPDGSIGAMTLETHSGDVALDRAAWLAITAEGKFPPLPQEFHGPNLELRTGFFYNTPIPETAAQPKKVGGTVSAPILIYAVEPEFSEEARKSKTSGNVKVSFWVDERGIPSHVHVLPGQGLGHGLDDLAVKAVQQCKFKPALENGQPVTVQTETEVNFQIF